MKKLFVLILFSLLNHLVAQPELTEKDFIIGEIGIDVPFDAVRKTLGEPSKMDSLEDLEVNNFRVYYYPGLIIWVANDSGTVSSFDISSPLYITSRKIRVGDDVVKLRILYGETLVEKELNRIHENYDTAFNDFSELMTYEYRTDNKVYYITFYLKKSKVVKIYMFKGLGC